MPRIWQYPLIDLVGFIKPILLWSVSCSFFYLGVTSAESIFPNPICAVVGWLYAGGWSYEYSSGGLNVVTG